MASTNIPRLAKSFTPNAKEVKYLNKTFSDFRQGLIELAKVYYPDTYRDFNETSPGMMFIEMASYVGDVLSYYIDAQFRESLLNFAQEQENIINIAQAFGFKPKPATAASTQADAFQIVPAISSASAFLPDSRYYLKIASNAVFSSEDFGSVNFRNPQEIDFADPLDRELTVFSVNAVNAPTFYLVRKKVRLAAGDIKTAARTYGNPVRFSKIILSDANALGIISVTDSNGNVWNEVDYLAQDLIIEDKENLAPASGSVTMSIAPRKLIKFKRQPRRFVTRYNENFELELFFGSGVLNDNDELVSLDSSKIASDEYETRLSSTTLDPADFLSSNTFGLAPSNTTLAITYVVGGGIASNVPANTINAVKNILPLNDRDVFTAAEQTLFDEVVRSLAVNNPDPASGGKGTDTVEEIRQNTLAFFNAQNRLVTPEDYSVRVHAMPPRFGGIAKSFIVQEDQLAAIENTRIADIKTTEGLPSTTAQGELVVNNGNPRLVNVYVLGFDQNKRLRNLNGQTKKNLKDYLSQYKMLTDQINIIDAFVVNIGVNFKIVVFKNQNINDTLALAIDSVRDFFSIDRWDINQPIVVNDLLLQIASVEGVQSVTDLKIVNKYAYRDGGDYENFRYDIQGNALDATSGIIFPSLDPMIFELRFPDTDIRGSAVQ